MKETYSAGFPKPCQRVSKAHSKKLAKSSAEFLSRSFYLPGRYCSAGHELDVEAGLQQHGDAQQRFSLLVHNQCVISHEDGVAFSRKSGHWKKSKSNCALGVDSIASDSFEQNALTLSACALSHTWSFASLNGGAFSWRSSRPGGVTLSSAEAEFVAASQAGQEAVYLRALLRGFNVRQVGATEIWEDNASCIMMSENPANRERTRHVDTPVHYLRVPRQVVEVHRTAECGRCITMR